MCGVSEALWAQASQAWLCSLGEGSPKCGPDGHPCKHPIIARALVLLPMAVLGGLLSERQPEPQERLRWGLPGSAVWAEWPSSARPGLRALGLPGPSSRGNKSRLGPAAIHPRSRLSRLSMARFSAPIPPFLLCMTNCFNKHKPGNNKVIISPQLTLYHCS